MPRDIPVSNGQMLVTFDRDYQIRDLYFPHVGQENHIAAGPCRFGVWSPLPQNDSNQNDRRKQRLFWSNQGWNISLGHQPDTVASDVRMRHDELQIALSCTDVVDFHRMLMVRRIDVENLLDQPRQIQVHHHNNFAMYGTRVGDTAYYDPLLGSLVHYRANRYILASFHDGQKTGMDEYATGTAGFLHAEGTWRDAEDGHLGGNAIAQGAVDSSMFMRVNLAARGRSTLYLVIGCGKSYADLEEIHRFLMREGPQGVIDRTMAYWRLWLNAVRIDIPETIEGGPSQRVIDLFKRSLLVMRTQIDNSGAVIAANDSDIMQFSRDTYSYLWPRDGALVSAALDDAGFPDVARSFYSLCTKLISEHGCFLHKYNPDGSPASSWHPWVSMGKPQLPIQEDETALVIWALWRHYLLYRDIEFVRPLWLHLIVQAADFMVRFRDPDTKLPMPSYNLWEDIWGVHAYTVASVYGGLQAAWRFATCFGDVARAQAYGQAAEELRQAFNKYFWSPEDKRFLRRIVPLDHARTAKLMAQVMKGQTPVIDAPAENGDATSAAPEFERDATIDSSLCGLFSFGLVNPDDPRMEATMRAIEGRLWVKTPVGGVARFENDGYHRVSSANDPTVPGNPWFICTLWLADWHIARAKSLDDLRKALPILDWVADHALPSGVLAEQVHPHHSQPLSVSPLTWSHAAFVQSVAAYAGKLETMNACPTCGQPRQCSATDHAQVYPRPVLAK